MLDGGSELRLESRQYGLDGLEAGHGLCRQPPIPDADVDLAVWVGSDRGAEQNGNAADDLHHLLLLLMKKPA